MNVLPCILELFRLATATLGEACIAYFAFIHHYLSACRRYGLSGLSIGGTCYALISLAMVVSTYIKNGMILAVVPTDNLLVSLGKGKERLMFLSQGFALLYLCQQPASAYYCGSLQELYWAVCIHLAGNNAGQVVLYRQHVDGHNLILMYHQTQCPLECL